MVIPIDREAAKMATAVAAVMLAAYLFLRYGSIIIADTMMFLYRNYGRGAVGAVIILGTWLFVYSLYNKLTDSGWDERDDL